MPKMVALTKFHYPSGPTGKEYQAGDELDVSDRDAKALRLVKRAKDKPVAAPEPAPTVKEEKPVARPKLEPAASYRTTAMKTSDMPQAGEDKPKSTTQGRPGTYKHEDMTAETSVGKVESSKSE
jgi:hypothetical protein